MLVIQDNEIFIPMHLTLHEGFNYIRDNSGTGKTFLFRQLMSYASAHGLNFGLVCSSNFNSFDFNKSYDLLILDNADLYLNEPLLKQCLSCNRYILCSVKMCLCFPLGAQSCHACKFSSNNGIFEVV